MSHTTCSFGKNMKDHEIRELINELRDVAIEYHASQQLRERISLVLRPIIKIVKEEVSHAEPIEFETFRAD